MANASGVTLHFIDEASIIEELATQARATGARVFKDGHHPNAESHIGMAALAADLMPEVPTAEGIGITSTSSAATLRKGRSPKRAHPKP